jgi:hypothetical protein
MTSRRETTTTIHADVADREESMNDPCDAKARHGEERVSRAMVFQQGVAG